MEPASGRSSSDLFARTEQLLEQVLEAPSDSQTELLEALCARHPDCATTLRLGHASLQNLDLLQVEPAAPAAATAPLAGGLPRSLGPFRLLELLGSGGMGAVYRAEDEELKRQVALKLVRSEMLASARTRSRFQREAAALARLDHPNLCTVYRAGTNDGQPWIAMRLVRGTTLAAVLDARRAERSSTAATPRPSATREELQAILLVFEKLAQALAVAHTAGVVHRDIKPANIVLTEADEPVLIDFGLVHLEDSASHLTLSGDHIGTPAYMAPEQVESAGREPGPGTDVYALGVTLFEVLTLQSPYAATGREALFHAIVRGERLRLRQARRALPADLELVLEKALDVDPARRYASMRELAEDLRRVRQHEPPAARPIGPALRLRRWCQRNPVAATFLSLLSLGLCTALLLNASREAALRRRTAMNFVQLSGQVLADNPEHALDIAVWGLELAPGDPEGLGGLLQALQEVHSHTRCRLPWPSSDHITVKDIVTSPTGDAAVILAARADDSFTPAALWRNDEVTLLPIEQGTFDAHWSPDGTMFVTAGSGGPPQLWSAKGELDTFRLPEQLRGIGVSRARILADNQHILMTSADGIARIHDRRNGTWIDLQPRLGAGSMQGLAVSGDGKRFALANQDGCVVVHETEAALAGKDGSVIVKSGPRIVELQLGRHGDLVFAYRTPRPGQSDPPFAAWSWKGDLLDSWGSRGKVFNLAVDPTRSRFLRLGNADLPTLFHSQSGKPEPRNVLVGHEGAVWEGHFQDDGKQVLTRGIDGTVRVWDTETGRPTAVLRGIDRASRRAAFLGNDHQVLLASAQWLHRVRLAPQGHRRIGTHDSTDWRFAFPKAGWSGNILACDAQQRLTIYREDGTSEDLPDEPIARRAGFQLSPDSRWLASTNWVKGKQGKCVARVYDATAKLQQVIELPDMQRPTPVFGPDDEMLLIDCRESEAVSAEVWIPDGSGSWQKAPQDVQGAFQSACAGAIAFEYHAATRTLAIGSPGAAARLYRWDSSPPRLQPFAPLLEGCDRARRIAFSPDGELLLLACSDRVVRLVDRAGNLQMPPLTGHLGTIVSIGISPRSNRILIAADESGITVHDIHGKLMLPIRPLRGTVQAAAFLPDGKHVLFSTTDCVTRAVPIEPDALLAAAQRVVKPDMPPAYEASYKARVGDSR
ncbi:MAG: protein kinase [Planctomycetes bacterium]|nr:protein kinase [Planctomycetota bacterium]MCC7396565.1 protein kinase [Planctomycetota bacterium]